MVPVPRGSARPLALLVLLAAGSYLAYLWLATDASWLHIELLGTPNMVWANPRGESDWQRLGKVFDWQTFDPIASRVRPLSDLAEVVDAIARPYLARVLGPHPSLTPVALLTAVGSPLFLFLYLRRRYPGTALPFLLCAVFVSCPGFLSAVIPYIRPAKKLAILLTCASLYFGQRHLDDGRRGSLFAFLGCMFLSFFTDEQALINFVVFPVLLRPSGLGRGDRWKWLGYLSLAPLYLVAIRWLLPAVYAGLGHGERWNTFSDPHKAGALLYLLQPRYWVVAAKQASRAVLSNVGVGRHVPLSQALAFAALAASPLLALLSREGHGTRQLLRHPISGCVLAVLVVSFWSTLLDMFCSPFQTNPFGSYNYYYHSSVSLFVVLWLGSVLAALGDVSIRTGLASLRWGSACCLVVVVANFLLFERVNDLVRVMHTYPFSPRAVNRVLAGGLAAHGASSGGSASTRVLRFTPARPALARRYQAAGRVLFGRRWDTSFFARQFTAQCVPHPMCDEAYLSRLARAYSPWNAWQVVIVDPPPPRPGHPAGQPGPAARPR